MIEQYIKKGAGIAHFNPTISHPFYFIRKGLLQGVEKYASQLSGRMMDFGCGQKPYASLFQVEEYVGVDYHGEGETYSKEKVDVFYDGKILPFPDNYFDSVFSSEVFEHIFNLEEILPEIQRTMKPNAKILITCPFVWNEHEVPADYARYTCFALRHLFEKHGFEILQIDKSGNGVQVIFQLMQLIIIPRLPFRSVLRPFVNLLGVVADRLFKEDTSIYLSNIVLAQKKS